MFADSGNFLCEHLDFEHSTITTRRERSESRNQTRTNFRDPYHARQGATAWIHWFEVGRIRHVLCGVKGGYGGSIEAVERGSAMCFRERKGMVNSLLPKTWKRPVEEFQDSVARRIEHWRPRG